jgi:hypothetical protein
MPAALQVFDFAAWTEHRSVSRYNKDMQGILTSRIVRGLAPPLIYTATGALAVSCYEFLQESGVLAQYIPGIPFPDLAVSVDGPFSISTFALSLLLVFRTNSSYERSAAVQGAGRKGSGGGSASRQGGQGRGISGDVGGCGVVVVPCCTHSNRAQQQQQQHRAAGGIQQTCHLASCPCQNAAAAPLPAAPVQFPVRFMGGCSAPNPHLCTPANKTHNSWGH